MSIYKKPVHHIRVICFERIGEHSLGIEWQALSEEGVQEVLTTKRNPYESAIVYRGNERIPEFFESQFAANARLAAIRAELGKDDGQ